MAYPVPTLLQQAGKLVPPSAAHLDVWMWRKWFCPLLPVANRKNGSTSCLGSMGELAPSIPAVTHSRVSSTPHLNSTVELILWEGGGEMVLSKRKLALTLITHEVIWVPERCPISCSSPPVPELAPLITDFGT